MKVRYSLLLVGLLLSSCQENCIDAPAPALTAADCFRGTVLGGDCGVPARAGYFLQLDRAIPEARSRINPTTGATEYLVSAINVPAGYQQPGSQLSFTLRRATTEELTALGPVIALCDQSWTVMYVENANSSPCVKIK